MGWTDPGTPPAHERQRRRGASRERSISPDRCDYLTECFRGQIGSFHRDAVAGEINAKEDRRRRQQGNAFLPDLPQRLEVFEYSVDRPAATTLGRDPRSGAAASSASAAA